MTDTLPQSHTSQTPPSPAGTPSPSGSMAKETGPHISFAEAPLLQEIGQETTLPREVANSGVTIHPTTVILPPRIQNLGVQAVGPAATPPAAAVAVTLPLTDDQIAQGLHQSLMSSWRWLAEWCERQLKQAHYMLKSIHGKIVRTTE